MFGLPGAKRVRRAELLPSAPPSPRCSSPASLDRPQLHLKLDLEFVDVPNDNATGPQTQTQAPDAQPSISNSTAVRFVARPTNRSDEEVFEFRLFGSPPHRANSAAPLTHATTPLDPLPSGVQRIKIRSPSPLLPSSSTAGPGAFVVPHRPQSYYFAAANREEEEEEEENDSYADVAVSGAQVLERAQGTRWPGTALPWRVIHLRSTTTATMSSTSPILECVLALPQSPALAPAPVVATGMAKGKMRTRRTRAGKKRRLSIRKRYAAAEMEREKRTRRNREKKVRKKERDKVRKQEKNCKEGDGAKGILVS